MTLLECLVGIALCALLLNPLLKTSADLVIKQIEYEKTQALISEADRAFALIGRAIRMAGYRNLQSNIESTNKLGSSQKNIYLELNKNSGFQGSDSLIIRHELADGIDFDAILDQFKSEGLRETHAAKLAPRIGAVPVRAYQA